MVTKEVATPEGEGPSKMVPTIEPVDTPFSNPPPTEPVARLVKVVVK